MKRFSRAIWILSLISLFTDIASEMLYPVMPLYLESIGFSIVLIGVLEGLAEATSGLSKGYFGRLSDRRGERLPFIRWGYGMSGLSRPLLALFVQPLWVFFARTLDRFGKGLRTGARDAMLSDLSEGHNRAAVFGFHRAMDTLGAVIGPGLALLYLHYFPGEYRTMFFLAIIPGIVAVALTFLIKETKREVKPKERPTLFEAFRYWKNSPATYKKLTGALLVFALINSSDMFLLLRLKSFGWEDTEVIGLFMFYNFFYALASYPLGVIADKLGTKRVFIWGLLLFALVYTGMAIGGGTPMLIGLFAIYGLYAAATQGITKAWISNIASKDDTATAIGTFSGFESLATLLASSLAGLIWFAAGPEAALGTSAVVALGVALFIGRKL